MCLNQSTLLKIIQFLVKIQCLILNYMKVKVKVTLEQATNAQRWSRGIAVLFP